MDRIDYTKRRPHRKMNERVQERVRKIKYQIEALNVKAELGIGHIYELGHIGKNRRLCLRKDGDIQAIGLLAIEEYLWTIRYFQASGDIDL